MKLEDLWAEIEAEQTWRIDELNRLQNLLSHLKTDDERDQFRRSMVLMLYAHFEGFCKFSFLHYVRAVNDERLECGEASYAIGAASLADVFAELRDAHRKCELFKHPLPNDSKLHRFARDREFVERVSEVEHRLVLVPDTVVDTESNLKPVVLAKILFRLDLPMTWIDEFRGSIDKLLEFRNKIAHGEFRSGVPEKTYTELSSDVLLVMRKVKNRVMEAISQKRFLRV